MKATKFVLSFFALLMISLTFVGGNIADSNNLYPKKVNSISNPQVTALNKSSLTNPTDTKSVSNDTVLLNKDKNEENQVNSNNNQTIDNSVNLQTYSQVSPDTNTIISPTPTLSSEKVITYGAGLIVPVDSQAKALKLGYYCPSWDANPGEMTADYCVTLD